MTRADLDPNAPTDNFPIAESREVMHRENHFATFRFSSGETGG